MTNAIMQNKNITANAMGKLLLPKKHAHIKYMKKQFLQVECDKCNNVIYNEPFTKTTLLHLSHSPKETISSYRLQNKNIKNNIYSRKELKKELKS